MVIADVQADKARKLAGAIGEDRALAQVGVPLAPGFGRFLAAKMGSLEGRSMQAPKEGWRVRKPGACRSAM